MNIVAIAAFERVRLGEATTVSVVTLALGVLLAPPPLALAVFVNEADAVRATLARAVMAG
jgi:hypothetical protein